MSGSTDVTQSLPNRLGARLAIAFSGQEATDPCDHTHHLVQARRGRRQRLIEQISGLDLIRVEEQLGVQVRTCAAHAHQVGDAPRYHQVQRQCTLDTLDGAQLQLLNAAAILQHVEQHFDFPARPVPVDQFADCSRVGGDTVGQQTPFDRLDAGRSAIFAGHDAGCADSFVLAGGQLNAAHPQVLAHDARLGAGARGQGELDLTERLSLRGMRPQLLAVGQATIVRGAHQPVYRASQLLRPRHQRHHVRFAVAHVDQARGGQTRCQFDQSLIAFNPTKAFLGAAALAVAALWFARPHPRIKDAERFAFRRHRVGWMHVHAALRFVAEWPQTLRLLSIEVQFSRILQTQHDRLRRHPLRRLLPVRFQNGPPIHVRVVEEAVRRHRLAPPVACLGTLAVGVAAILSISVLARRFRRASPRSSCPNSVAVHAVDLLAICAVQKTRVNLKRPQFTRGAGKSLNVKDYFRASDAGYRLVYNEVGYGGAHYDVDLAWAYYLRAAQLGSPEAQMALASAYGEAKRPADEIIMQQCAYRQGHGPAAYELALDALVNMQYQDAIEVCQEGLKFGILYCVIDFCIIFNQGYWDRRSNEEKNILKSLGIGIDPERERRYDAIYDALKINPDLKLSRLDQVLPLPPTQLPAWSGVGDAVTPESNDRPTY